MHCEQFLFAGDLVKIVGSYIYLGVLFSGSIFAMCLAMQAWISMGYAALARLERQCYHSTYKIYGPSLFSLILWSTLQLVLGARTLRQRVGMG